MSNDETTYDYDQHQQQSTSPSSPTSTATTNTTATGIVRCFGLYLLWLFVCFCALRINCLTKNRKRDDVQIGKCDTTHYRLGAI